MCRNTREVQLILNDSFRKLDKLLPVLSEDQNKEQEVSDWETFLLFLCEVIGGWGRTLLTLCIYYSNLHYKSLPGWPKAPGLPFHREYYRQRTIKIRASRKSLVRQTFGFRTKHWQSWDFLVVLNISFILSILSHFSPHHTHLHVSTKRTSTVQ